jgi:predicted dehydrogenase
MVDVLFYLAEAPVTLVYAQIPPIATSPAGDDVLLTLSFANGSMGTIAYAASGDPSLPKERLEVFGDGKAAVLDDFMSLKLHHAGRTSTSTQRGRPDKGHAAELRAFVEAVLTGGPSPIDPEDAAHVTRITFAAAESARTGLPVECGPVRT